MIKKLVKNIYYSILKRINDYVSPRLFLHDLEIQYENENKKR